MKTMDQKPFNTKHKTMKPMFPLKLIVTLLLTFIVPRLHFAQNYDFTLLRNSDFNFTIAAVSLFDSGSYAPVTSGYGFVLILPQGVTFTVDQVLPSGTDERVEFVPGTSVSTIDPSMADKDIFSITTENDGASINPHANAEQIPLVTITVNGNPFAGEIRLLDNNSILATGLPGVFDAYFFVDVNDSSLFPNEYNGLTGTEVHSFQALSLDDSVVSEDAIVLHPNPFSDTLYIESSLEIEGIELFDVKGKLVFEGKATRELSLGHLQQGIYMLTVETVEGKETIKVVKDR